jgi:hypothetical protein
MCSHIENIKVVPEQKLILSLKKLRGFSPLANYTDRAIAAGQRS